MPHELLACAQHLAETENVNVTQIGPASRQVDVACDAHCLAKPRAGESADDAEWEQVGEEAKRAAEPTDAERAQYAFETNTAETVIAVDHTNDPGLLQTCAAFQTKLHAVQAQAARVLATQPQHEDQRSNSVGEPAAPASVETACASAAEREQCRTLVLGTQELANKLAKTDLKRMANALMEQEQAVVSTSGAPLSMRDPESWPKCFLEFFLWRRCAEHDQERREGDRHCACAF